MPDHAVNSFFAGIGGFDLGFAQAGFRTLSQSENNPACLSVLRRHFPEALQLGDVKAIDPDMVPDADVWCAGFPCFTKGTLVLSRDGYRPIEDIEVGDEVLTHQGRWRRVTATMSKGNAPLRRVMAQGVVIMTTDEHPFYARVRTTVWDSDRRMGVRSFGNPRWVAAGDITKNHFLAQVLPTVRPDRHPPEFWRLVGRYLADGWRVRRKSRKVGGRTVVCCSHEESGKLREIITSAGFRATLDICRTTTKFHIVNNRLYGFLEPFGHLAHGKTLPGFALSLSAEKSAALLDGYMSGDGSAYESGVRATTVSKRLAFGMALLAQRTGVVASINLADRPLTTTIEGRTVRQRPTWIVMMPRSNRSGFIEGRYGWKLVKTSERCGHGTVHNISVEEDESYVADGAVVHNCQNCSLACAGPREGLKGAKTGLFFPFMRLVEARVPGTIVLENVSGLLSSNSGGDFRTVLTKLSGLGYAVAWRTLNSRWFGVPQSRPRVFVVACRPALDAAAALFEPSGPSPGKRDGAFRKADSNGVVTVPRIAFCLAASGGRHTGTDWSRTYVVDGGEARRLTPEECEAIQGFPAGWTREGDRASTASDSPRYRMCGNAVSVPVAKWVASNVLRRDAPDMAAHGFGESVPQEGCTHAKWPAAGLWADGCCAVAPSCSAAPSEAVASRLIDCVSGGADRRFFFSPNAAAGAIRRTDAMGRTLFPPLRAAMERMSSSL